MNTYTKIDENTVQVTYPDGHKTNYVISGAVATLADIQSQLSKLSEEEPFWQAIVDCGNQP